MCERRNLIEKPFELFHTTLYNTLFSGEAARAILALVRQDSLLKGLKKMNSATLP